MEKVYLTWIENCKQNKELYDELISIKGKEAEISDRFYRGLEFGTGGLRGTIGAGTNRMNIYTVGRATLGFGKYLKAKLKK